MKKLLSKLVDIEIYYDSFLASRVISVFIFKAKIAQFFILQGSDKIERL